MRKIKVITILFSICFVFAQISYPVAAADIDYDQDVSLTRFNGLEIVDIEAPDVIIRCFSEIVVNVTVKNNKPWRIWITTSVFLKEEENQLVKNGFYKIGHKISRIGPSEEIKISITCKTLRRISQLLYFMPPMISQLLYNMSLSPKNHEKAFNEGLLGVRVFRGAHPFRHRFINRLSLDEFLITWKPVSLVDPFITKEIFNFEWLKIPEETNRDGTFCVEVNVSNDFHIDIPLSIIIFIRQDIVFGTLPRYMSTFVGYPAGAYSGKILKNSSINETIECLFPKENFQEGYYDIRVLLYGYIPTEGNENRLSGAKYYFEVFLTPPPFANIYLKEFWGVYGGFFSNAPIVNSGSYIGAYRWGTTIYVPHRLGKIYLTRQTPTDKQLERAINKSVNQAEELINKTMKDTENLSSNLIFLFEKQAEELINKTIKDAKSFSNYFFLQLLAVLLTVVGFGLVTYWAIRKKT